MYQDTYIMTHDYIMTYIKTYIMILELYIYPNKYNRWKEI